MFDRLIKFLIALAAAIAIIGSVTVRAHGADLTATGHGETVPNELPPSAYPIGLELTYQGVAALDAWQTSQLPRYGFHETNPIMGRHPSNADIAAYFIASGAIHALITAALPPKAARLWEYASIGFELGVVTHNYSLGVRFRGP